VVQVWADGEGDFEEDGNDGLEHEDFELILKFTRHRIGTLVDALVAGRITPQPFRDRNAIGCDQCEFSCACPFDRVHGAFRDVPRMKAEEALEAMRREVDGE